MYASQQAASLPLARPAGYFQLMRAGLAANGLALGLLAIQTLALLAIYALHPLSISGNIFEMLSHLALAALPLVLFFMAAGRFLDLITTQKLDRPALTLLKDLRATLTDSKRLSLSLPAILGFVLFLYTFEEMKANIPVLNPFAWDETFAAWDRALHFGQDPWQILAPVFGSSFMLHVLDKIYVSWFAALFLFWSYFCFQPQLSELRSRYLFSFIATWVVGGNVLAIVFSSMGPCFYGSMAFANDTFGPLMASLHAEHAKSPLVAVELQDSLWNSYLNRVSVVSISAMPSMHNATNALFVFAGFSLNRKLGWAMVVYALLILIGSVMLGWHYAIDGYFGWAIAGVIWWISAPLVRWWHARPDVAAYALHIETSIPVAQAR